MLNPTIFSSEAIAQAAAEFHRDGFVCIANPLSSEQFEILKTAAERVMHEQENEFGREKMNRGYARHSFGNQLQNWEWCMLIDLPPILAILDEIWRNEDFTCRGAGGDFSLPGAKIQHLHADGNRDFFHDPWSQVTHRDTPSAYICVNFTMEDFTVENGATRFVPGTQRSRAPIPNLEEEPGWMRNNHLCVPANTAIFRDVRCWHGGTANNSRDSRAMTGVGYQAPWYRPNDVRVVPRRHFERLSTRGRQLCRYIVEEK